VIITTREEYNELKSRYAIDGNIIFDDELNGDNAIIKAKIVRMLKRCSKSYSSNDDVLLIGVDPGKRIGLTVLYMYNELDSRVMISVQDTVYTIEKLIKDIKADRCIVKIGYGERKIAKEIARMLHLLLMDKVEIELVDEYGTSRCMNSSNKRGIRDKVSAKAIALRKGVPFKP
jgi:hypothetical protein